jgi:hypothetical protein
MHQFFSPDYYLQHNEMQYNSIVSDDYLFEKTSTTRNYIIEKNDITYQPNIITHFSFIPGESLLTYKSSNPTVNDRQRDP